MKVLTKHLLNLSFVNDKLDRGTGVFMFFNERELSSGHEFS